MLSDTLEHASSSMVEPRVRVDVPSIGVDAETERLVVIHSSGRSGSESPSESSSAQAVGWIFLALLGVGEGVTAGEAGGDGVRSGLEVKPGGSASTGESSTGVAGGASSLTSPQLATRRMSGDLGGVPGASSSGSEWFTLAGLGGSEATRCSASVSTAAGTLVTSGVTLLSWSAPS
jgi:hypothetical protein